MSTFYDFRNHVDFLTSMELPSRVNYGTSDNLMLDVGPAITRLVNAVGDELKERGYPSGDLLIAYLNLVPYRKASTP